MKISEALDLFVTEKDMIGVKESTIKTYTDILNNLFIPLVSDKEVNDLNFADLQSFIIAQRKKDISVNTVKTYYRHVKVFVKYLYDSDLLEKDITKKIPPLKGYSYSKDIYLDDEIELIFASINGHSRYARMKRLIFALLINTGIRASEVCDIRIDDINISHKYIKVRGSKGRMDRKVPICTATLKLYDHYLQKRVMAAEPKNDDYLFIGREGEPITRASLTAYVKHNVKGQGIKRGTVHLFRHTYITRLCMESRDAFMVQQLAGHQSLDTTKGYYQAASSYKLAKVEMMPIDRLLASIRYY